MCKIISQNNFHSNQRMIADHKQKIITNSRLTYNHTVKLRRTETIFTVTNSNNLRINKSMTYSVTVEQLVAYASVCPELSADREVGSASFDTGLFFWLWFTRESPSCSDAPNFWLTSATYKIHWTPFTLIDCCFLSTVWFFLLFSCVTLL